MDTIHWIVFMVAGFCFFWIVFSFMHKRKEKNRKNTGETSAGKSEETNRKPKK